MANSKESWMKALFGEKLAEDKLVRSVYFDAAGISPQMPRWTVAGTIAKA